MDFTIFEDIVRMLIGVPPETFENLYQFLIYYLEVMIRIGLFGFVLRFFMNLVALPFRRGEFRMF